MIQVRELPNGYAVMIGKCVIERACTRAEATRLAEYYKAYGVV